MENHHQSTSATYTTIPISHSNVISRSLHNLSTTLSRHLRPWPQLLGSGSQSFSRPPNSFLAHASANSRYFRANYAIVIAATSALSLIGFPLSLFFCSGVFALWLLLYFFREDPLVLWGHCVSDRFVLLSLAFLSVLAVWVCDLFENLALGLVIGVLICGAHALLRNSDGLYIDEDAAVSTGLVRPAASD
ncbi:Tir-nbs resistance protein [Hibiscus syriacus]|uniref:PRA1 family protein n=1 Tax=Hibiscus syriacus TaxID=106335 RepID=A0A6A2WZA3_HIBSY|nr:PRA1 family protein G2 [Hibiscus syriacus]KAE8667051.1 Tir-nbs resistance protein [Hibiscus syriacus]